MCYLLYWLNMFHGFPQPLPLGAGISHDFCFSNLHPLLLPFHLAVYNLYSEAVLLSFICSDIACTPITR